MAHGIWGAVPSFYYEAMPEKKLLKMTNIMTCFYSYGKKYRKDLKSGLNREREINSKLKKVYLLFKMWHILSIFLHILNFFDFHI